MSQATESRVTPAEAGIGNRERRVVIAILTGAAVLIAAYWVIWFAVDRSILASDTRDAYYEFENAFPLADGWLVLCLVVAILQLSRRRATVLLWLLAGGGADIYLAGMDVLYDIEHRIWFHGGGGRLIELGINLVTFALSAGLLAWSWRRRGALLAGGQPQAPRTARGVPLAKGPKQ